MNEIRQRVINELVNQLKTNVEGLENLTTAGLNLEQTFDQLGASSLDMVEVVSNMVSKLRVTVDRTAFARLNNLEELVQLFEREIQKTG